MGCQNSSNNTELSKDSQRAAIVQENVAPIHVICNQLVNGYRVSMDMLMDGEEDNWGFAVFTFQKTSAFIYYQLRFVCVTNRGCSKYG